MSDPGIQQAPVTVTASVTLRVNGHDANSFHATAQSTDLTPVAMAESMREAVNGELSWWLTSEEGVSKLKTCTAMWNPQWEHPANPLESAFASLPADPDTHVPSISVQVTLAITVNGNQVKEWTANALSRDVVPANLANSLRKGVAGEALGWIYRDGSSAGPGELATAANAVASG